MKQSFHQSSICTWRGCATKVIIRSEIAIFAMRIFITLDLLMYTNTDKITNEFPAKVIYITATAPQLFGTNWCWLNQWRVPRTSISTPWSKCFIRELMRYVCGVTSKNVCPLSIHTFMSTWLNDSQTPVLNIITWLIDTQTRTQYSYDKTCKCNAIYILFDWHKKGKRSSINESASFSRHIIRRRALC